MHNRLLWLIEALARHELDVAVCSLRRDVSVAAALEYPNRAARQAAARARRRIYSAVGDV